MAQTHNALDASLLGPAIRAALGIRDGTETIERFSETLQPIIDLWGRPDFAFLRQENLCTAAFTNAAGGAGNMTEASLTNPAGSGIIATVEMVVPLDIANKVIRTKVATATDLGTTQNVAAFRDLRTAIASATRKPFCTVTTKNGDAATHGFVCHEWLESANAISIPDHTSWILKPGSSLIWDPTTTNTAITLCINWRERKALRGELVS